MMGGCGVGGTDDEGFGGCEPIDEGREPPTLDVPAFGRDDDVIRVPANMPFRISLRENPGIGDHWKVRRRPNPEVACIGAEALVYAEPDPTPGTAGARVFDLRAGEAPGRTTMVVKKLLPGRRRLPGPPPGRGPCRGAHLHHRGGLSVPPVFNGWGCLCPAVSLTGAMAKIADLLAAGTTRSFEFFPPKSEEGAIALEAALDDLALLEPSFVSVTYGALGTTRERTRDVVIRINRDRSFPAMPHLTCVGHTRAQLTELLDQYRAAGIENILALAGDPPADGSPAGGDFTYATELVELVHEAGDFSVAVAAFPEVHPRSPDRATDRRQLAAKLEAADFGLTQFFFDAEHYLRMRDELAALGCDRPVLAGVMPFISISGALRMSAMNGTDVPLALRERMDSVDGDAEATRKLGVEVASDLCTRLLAEDVPGLHLYALNRSDSIRDIYANVGLTAGR